MSILDAFRLDNKVALVTGASTGLGQAIAIALAEAGTNLACHRNKNALDDTCNAVTRAGRQAITETGDFTDRETPRR